MAIDQEVLATLKRIEKIMNGQSNSAPQQNNRARIAGGASNADAQVTGKKGKVFQAVAKGLAGVSETADTLNKSFLGLNRTVLMTRSNFVAMNKQMRQMGRQSSNTQQTPSAPSILPIAQSAAPAQAARQAASTSRFNNALATTTGAIQGAGPVFARLAGVAKELGVALKAATNDAFFFASRGLSAGAGFNTLYIDAMKAGMSVRDYTQALADNTPAVIRANSMADFGKSMDQTRAKLGALGIFGEDATKLGMAMANNATVLGVSQKDQDAAATAQTSVFAQLRKTTLMTAQQFQALTSDLADNAEVQGNLLGLGQQSRIHRFNEIVQIQTLGQRLGATEKASRALGDALLAQRQQTLSSRFEAQGLMRQAGAMLGIDSGVTERASMLMRKKNLSFEESAELQALAVPFSEAINRANNSGNPVLENLAEQMESRLNQTNAGRIIQTSGSVGLTEQSGEIKSREEFGQGASDLMQGAGKLLTYANGLSKSPLGMAGVGIVSSLAGAIVGAIGFKGIGKVLSGTFGAIKSLGTKLVSPTGPGMVSRGASAIASGGQAAWNGIKAGSAMFGSAMSSVWQTLSKPSQYLAKAGSAVSSVTSTLGKAFSGLSSFFSSSVTKMAGWASGAGKLLPAVMNALKRIPGIGMLISAVTEVFTGTVDAAFSDGEGSIIGRIGNTIFAAITSVFGGIADLVDGVIKFFGGDGLNLRNAFDKFAAVMRGGFFAALASIAKVVTLGSDNKLSNYFQEAADNSFKVLDQLSEDQTATISSIGDKNKKKIDEQKAASAKAVETMTNVTAAVNASAGIVSSTSGMADDAIKTARTIAAQQTTPISPAAQKAIVDPSVSTTVNNTTQQAAEVKAAEKALGSVNTDNSSLATLLQTVVDLLREGNLTANGQATALEAISRMGSRSGATDNNVLLDRLASNA